jgi:hypothetical protein
MPGKEKRLQSRKSLASWFSVIPFPIASAILSLA